MKNNYRNNKRTYFSSLLLAFVLMLTNFSICSATTYGTNLVVNGNGGDGTATTGWTNSDATNFTSYTAPPVSSVNGGNVFDYYPGGTGSTATLVQTIDISDKTSDISGNGVKAILNGEVFKYLSGDIARITLEQLNAGNSVLVTTTLESDGINTWQSKSVTIPKLNTSTVKLKITLTASVTGTNGSEYVEFDGIELILSPLTPPTITTQAVSSITATTATGNGNITALGTSNPTAYGVCWNTTGTPTTSDSKADNGAASVTGAFTASMTSLSANTTYYVRAFATNTGGTSYGTEVTFTTSAIAPTVTTQAVSSIAAITATGNGNITALGSPNPTAYGICWNTTGTPTTANSKVDKGSASTTGAFTVSMTSLTATTTYYVRAFATNTAGTSYGDEVTFTTAVATGIDDVKLEGVTIFPNPVDDRLYIKGVDEGEIAVYDMGGSKVISARLESNKAVDVSGLTKGVYTVRITTPNGTAEKKLVKK